MKVKIGKYKNWFGPYQLAELLCFWAKEEKDEYGFSRKPEWVNNFGEWLAHGEIQSEDDNRLFNNDRKNTWLYNFLLWIDSKKTRKISIKIDPWDTWNMDNTLALIIVPMLKQLKETKYGAPFVDDQDVPEHLRSTAAPPRENEWDIDENHVARWDWVLDEIIFAFDSKINDDWKDQFESGDYDLRREVAERDSQGKPTLYRIVEGPNHTRKCDEVALNAMKERITNGFKLFGKYYEALWD